MNGFLTVVLSSSSGDDVFALILGSLVILLAVLIIMAVKRGSAEKKKTGSSAVKKDPTPSGGTTKAGPAEKPPESGKEGGGLIVGKGFKPISHVTPPGGRPATGGEDSVPEDRKSMDTRYAEQTGQWVCRYCECINDDKLTICQACGNPRSR